ncbi:kinase-like domain-containing protein [Cantharellus anzutake]|uniref:kinase-like domain-containing protein n=1 Tax=Cantharellus anzutake TaxID=1750568 RepID=UPI0019077A42|nr:kinase-like domain-containing protein [Cantharellus anzutake]KAF8337579.1 kinase-like domain-containing protein [Cantharellus anzutake]
MLSHPLPIKGATANHNAASVNLDKEEGAREYGPGGYKPLAIGDVLRKGRYTVVRKLGWGHFSTVWLVHDKRTSSHVALKVVKSNQKYMETARDEIKLLRHIRDSPNPNHPGRIHVVQFLDWFELKPDDGISSIMTMEPLGETLLSLLRRLQSCDETNLKTGIPTFLVQQIVRQMLHGLDFLHTECRLIHTDLKLENVMVLVEDVEELVRACYASEQMMGVSPTSANRVVAVPVPSSLSRPHDKSGTRNVQIFGSYPLPSPLQEWGRENAGPEVESLARIMAESKPLTTRAGVLGTGKGIVNKAPTKTLSSDSMIGSGASSLVSVESGLSKFSMAALSSAATSVESSMVEGHKIGERIEGFGGAESMIAISYTPTPTPAHAPSLLTASAPIPPTRATSRGRSRTNTNHKVHAPATTAPPRIRIKIADLGNATPIKNHFTPDIQTRQYRAPEVILGFDDWDESADLWSVGTMAFELLTSDYLFAPEEKKGRYTKDDDHIAQIIELLGDLPHYRKFGGRESRNIFTQRGELRRITKLKPWPLEQVLVQKYDYPPRQAKALKDFLVMPLSLDPADRPSAKELAEHPWLDMEDAAPPYPTANRFNPRPAVASTASAPMPPVPPINTEGSSDEGSLSNESSPNNAVASIAALD